MMSFRGDRGLVVDSFDEGLEWRIQRGAGRVMLGGFRTEAEMLAETLICSPETYRWIEMLLR